MIIIPFEIALEEKVGSVPERIKLVMMGVACFSPKDRKDRMKQACWVNSCSGWGNINNIRPQCYAQTSNLSIACLSCLLGKSRMKKACWVTSCSGWDNINNIRPKCYIPNITSLLPFWRKLGKRIEWWIIVSWTQRFGTSQKGHLN